LKISVITATYNAIDHLPNLVESLRNQSDKDFEWVVADGASTDGTLEYLQSITDLNLKVISQEDFGIYDALNRGVKASSGEFYVVTGADDILYPNAISTYKAAISDDVGIITANIDVGNFIAKPKEGMAWFYGMGAIVSGHSVGCCIRRSLHEKFGYYSRNFPICADQLFIGMVFKNQVPIKAVDIVVGVFELQGLSSIDVLGMLTEFYRIQVRLGLNKYIQSFLFMLRLVKNIKNVRG
jgi:glycosyltransferase